MRLPKLLVIFFYILLSIRGMAQHNYVLRPGTDIPLVGLGIGSITGGWLSGKNVKALTPEQIASHQRRDVFRINRFAIPWYSAKADRGSDLAFYTATLAPLLLLVDPQIRRQALPVSLLYFETLSLASGLTLLTKNLATTSRPYVYHPEVPFGLKQRKDARKSFFSGHTSVTAAACFFTARVWADQHPGRQSWKPVVWTAAATLPAFTGYLRMRAGKHFFTDVLTGYAVGTAVGLLVPVLHHQ